MSAQWEYNEFVWTNRELNKGYASADMLAQARYEWWSEARSEIMRELQKFLDEGWEPTTQIGPENWEIEESKVPEARFWNPLVWLFWLFFLIPSFGLVILFLFKTVTIYKPKAFRVQLHRRKS